MREHEVPTHVQAEDKVLLWFTFPQIVAVLAVCAVSYGAYRYAPFGPSEVRLALAALLGMVGIAMIVGKVGGRGLPLVVADLLKYRLGARRYAGSPAELARPEAPAPDAAQGRPNPLLLLAQRIGKRLSGLRKSWRRRRGRRPFRPHGWFGKRRNRRDGDGGNPGKPKETRNKKPWRLSLALAALALTALLVPHAALADGPWSEDAWRLDEVRALPPDPVPGRGLFVEDLAVIARTAWITIRAATDLKLDARAYGGGEGRTLTFFVADHMQQGEAEIFGFSLDGPNPSFIFAWQDGLGQTGALALKGRQLPHPLPMVEGEVCSLKADTLGWTLGAISGVVVSECASQLEERVSLPVSGGHHRQSMDAMLTGAVTGVTGTVSVSAGGARTSVPFVPGGVTSFHLPIALGEAVHDVTIEAALEASLQVAQPPLVQLTHRPQRTEQRTETVSLLRPGTSRYVSRTVSVALPPDGRVVQYTIGATLSIPSETVQKDVTLEIDHPEHVRAEVVQRGPLARSRKETVVLDTTLASDASYTPLVLPQPTPAPPTAEHRPLNDDEATDLFQRPGWWEWP